MWAITLKSLQHGYEFPEGILESKLLKAQELLAEEKRKTLKPILKQTVPSFTAKPRPPLKPLDAEALDLLRQNGFVPLNAAMFRLPGNMLAQFSQELTADWRQICRHLSK